MVGATIDGRINDNLIRMGQMAGDLLRASNHTCEVLKKADEDKSDALRDIWDREQKVKQFKSRLPWFGLGAVVLAMTLLLPRFLGSYPAICAALGATWTSTTSNVDACVFLPAVMFGRVFSAFAWII